MYLQGEERCQSSRWYEVIHVVFGAMVSGSELTAVTRRIPAYLELIHSAPAIVKMRKSLAGQESSSSWPEWVWDANLGVVVGSLSFVRCLRRSKSAEAVAGVSFENEHVSTGVA